MAAYEVGDELLAQTALMVYSVKSFLELLKLCERGLAHQCQYRVRCVLWSYFKTAAHMLAYEFAGIIQMGLVGLLVRVAVLKYVVSDAAAYAGFLYSGYAVGLLIKLCQRR